jgi:hypothetical protein
MLFLLRKTRRKLMQNNKTTTYLLYAIGEIILVVIGILVAVQIDSTYNDYQTKQLEIKYLKELRSNLLFDIKDIKFNIDFNQSRYNSNQIVLEHLRKRLPYHDSLDFHLSNLLFSTRSLPNMGAYESLKSKGLEIISNDTLRSEITKMYSFSYHNVIDFEHIDDHLHQYNVMWPAVMNVIEVGTLKVDVIHNGTAKPIDYGAMLDNVQFKNALASNLTFRQVMLETYKDLNSSVAKLIINIESELAVLE